MNTIKYSENAACPKCGGLLCYDATLKDRLPLGFGFAPGSTRFRVDYLERTGFRGECMQCGEKVFAVKSQRATHKHPPKINRKLAALTR